ncbi:quinol dehydrogenase ferredoxin subunit NapH [Campylobacter corcagiensis]|uniref:Quinol dehydrogenase ferredoxin subunit NapH n=1 Tax=Campylobacter corcagiensis TaxID=1448857 RepID=A0A7M1LED9_9BACT|nr:quinol dehydrogenase ferredoxin subunit NapH [Campylobacter corcagiensis]QKF64901.1 menaquinol dehydrogenase NapGH, membrane component NapH [Campylobacter corcagiensis]QOQ86939.1 quinol dehydrogenase ferredoxin subunit NapH [Campylobacter corcagiensis]
MRVNLVRRVSQILIIVLFILGNLGILSVLKGNLSSSVFFSFIPLSDPYAVLQIYLASGAISLNAILGAFIIAIFYAFIAPRAFCSWVCPVNLITDFAYFIREKFGYKKDRNILMPSKNLRYYLLILSFILSFLLSRPIFEEISFIGFLQRGLIILNITVISTIFVIFAFEVFISQRGICSKICPLGAFYAVLSKFSFIRVKHRVKNCSKCMDCIVVCPEKQVLNMVGKKDGVVSSECISCGRCVDICKHDALNFSIKKGLL